MEYRRVPDSLREGGIVRKGRAATKELSKRLLDGETMFVEGRPNLGSIYTLAKHHDKQARTKRKTINGVEGIIVWMEEIPKDT